MPRPPTWLAVTLTVVVAIVASLAVSSLGSSPTSADPKKPMVGPCVNGIAIPNSWGNPSLIQDCNVLLGIRNTLTNSASINWSADVRIDRWDHIKIGGFPGRVTEIRLSGSELNGTIPPELGKLTELRKLNLSNNSLTGSIPSELGDLTNLTHLYLNANRLTGEIPSQLSILSNLQELWLQDNALTDEIPVALSELHGLEYLYLQDNELTGCIPKALADRSGLRLRTDDTLKLCVEATVDDLPLPEGPCANGVAVSNPRHNPELVADCNALLASRDTLAGDATLNWSVDVPIDSWQGVTIGREPLRVWG